MSTDTAIPTEENAILTVEQVGRVLHASRATVYRILKDGDLASIKVGKSRVIRRGALDEFVRRSEASSRRSASA